MSVWSSCSATFDRLARLPLLLLLLLLLLVGAAAACGKQATVAADDDYLTRRNAVAARVLAWWDAGRPADEAAAVRAEVETLVAGATPRLLPRCFAETVGAARVLADELADEARVRHGLCSFAAATKACETEAARQSKLRVQPAPFAPAGLDCP